MISEEMKVNLLNIRIRIWRRSLYKIFVVVNGKRELVASSFLNEIHKFEFILICYM